MDPNMYLYEKAREAHYQDLRRKVEARRLLKSLPRHHWGISRHVAGKLSMLLLKLSIWLRQFEQPDTTLKDHV